MRYCSPPSTSVGFRRAGPDLVLLDESLVALVDHVAVDRIVEEER